MKVLVIARLRDHATADRIAPHTRAQAAAVWRAYRSNELREMYGWSSDTAALQTLFNGGAPLDHIFVTAATSVVGPIANTDVATLRPTLDSHIWGTYNVARLAAPHLSAGGSVTVLSNGFVERPVPGVAVLAAAMAGVEGMVRALALELAPLRVNVVRASTIDTPLFRAFYGGADDAQVAAIGATLLLKRVARAEEAAAAALFCMANPYVTGSVVVVDGGTSLV